MSTDVTRCRGFCADIARRLRGLSLAELRAIDRAVLTFERGGPVGDSDLAIELDDVLRDVVAGIEAEERAEDEAHERARDGMFAALPPVSAELLAERDRLLEGLPRGPAALGMPAGLLGDELQAFDDQLAATRREHRRALDRLETVSIGNAPGDGGEPYPLPSPAPRRHLALVDEPDARVVDEFEIGQHLTPGDAEEPIGVQVPDWDFEGGAG